MFRPTTFIRLPFTLIRAVWSTVLSFNGKQTPILLDPMVYTSVLDRRKLWFFIRSILSFVLELVDLWSLPFVSSICVYSTPLFFNSIICLYSILFNYRNQTTSSRCTLQISSLPFWCSQQACLHIHLSPSDRNIWRSSKVAQTRVSTQLQLLALRVLIAVLLLFSMVCPPNFMIVCSILMFWCRWECRTTWHLWRYRGSNHKVSSEK